MKKIAIIPARYKSSRFEGKPLATIADRPMVIWVYDSVIGTQLFDKVVIATDDERIYSRAEQFGAEVMMTSEELSCGTERCKAVLQTLEDKGEKYDVVVNIQGDEPLIKKQQIERVLDGFCDKEADIVTLCKQIDKKEDISDPNVVKVVFDNKLRALYFSRSTIPFDREAGKRSEVPYYKHIGIYGYRSEVLKKICSMDQSFLEKTEKLEQLRWLENGLKIVLRKTDIDTIGVDTKEDLEKVRKIVNK